MFEIGDKVRIKSWKQMVEEFGLNNIGNIECEQSFVLGMKYLCRKKIIIDRIHNNRIQDIDDWSISFDMIEKI